jgi:hypothetical protein
MNTSSHPCVTKTSASPIVATVRPTAPEASWRRAISTVLCVFACGRIASLATLVRSAAARTLRRIRGRSTWRYGVGAGTGSG